MPSQTAAIMKRLGVVNCFFVAQTFAFQSAVWIRATEPGNCEPYVVQAGDTCLSIARSANATYAQIISWNDEIDLACSNLGDLEGDEICISNPLGDYAIPRNSHGDPTIITTTAPIPTPTPDGTNPICAEYHFVESGEDCSTITTQYSITLKDFLFLNQHVWENCTNVWAEYHYCVRPVGYLSTYPGYLPPTSTKEFVETPTTDLPDSRDRDFWSYFTRSEPPIPIAEGTRLDCWRYFYLEDITDSMIADCWLLAITHGITAEDLILWNPSLGEEPTVSGVANYAYPCTIAPSSSYCVELSSPTPAPPAPPPPAPPSPRAAGEIENCTKWFQPESFHTCETVLLTTDLNIDQFYSMNPSVKSDCSGMTLGTYYCISTHPDGLPPPADDDDDGDGDGGGSSLSSTVSQMSSSTTASGGVPTPTPVQEGMVDGCEEFYFVKPGDGCWAIANAYGIELDDFYVWNPAVQTDCTGLLADVYVCIAV